MAIEAIKIPDEIEKQLLAVEMLPVSALVVDHTYQRPEDTSRVQQMVKTWNWLACGHLAVSLRTVTVQLHGGRTTSYYAVIDGQQRLAAIKALGYSEAPCRIYLDLTPEQEAELFELLNKNKKPGYNDIFKARLARNEQVASAINAAVESIGYHLDPERKHAGGRRGMSVDAESLQRDHYYIQTMQEMERMHRAGGTTHIMDVLRFVKACWGGEHLDKQAQVFSGVSRFITLYPEHNRSELIVKVKKEGLFKILQAAGIIGSLTSGGTASRANAFAEALLNLYNRGRREVNKIKSKA